MSAPATDLVVECRGLSKTFHSGTNFADLLRGRLRGRAVRALQGVDLEVTRGELLAIVGPNGAGKSTLLRLFASLLFPDEGQLSVLGLVPRRADHAFRARVSYVVSDERSFSWRLTGQQNLEFFAALYRLRGRIARQRIANAMGLVGLEGDADRPVREYSSGMRSRLAFARALLGAPELWLFDEPTRGVDPASALRLRLMVRRLVEEQGGTALIATHDLSEVRQLCTRVILLDQGQVRGGGDPGQIAQLVGLDALGAGGEV